MKPRMEKPAPTLKPGQIVFFPVCKKTTKPAAQPAVFKGHGFGVFLGVVPHGIMEPTRQMMTPLMAAIGWISFDDVAEFLGEEQLKELITKFKERHEAPPGEEASPIQLPPERPRIIGLDGNEIVARNPNDSECAGPREN